MIKVNMPFYDGIEDFTFFVKKADIPIKFIELPKRNVNLLQWDDTVQLEFDFGSGVATVVGRLNVSSCYGGEAVSCSFRATQEIPKLATLRYHEAAYAINHCGYKPSTRQSTPDQAEQTELYLNSEKDLCDIIYNRIFSAAPAGAQGLIIVAGATATGKSRIARGLIYKYLATQIPTGSVNDRKRRRPHLVTVEEPIDKLWAADYDGARQTGIDYTPRERKKDVKDLKDAVDASLRQTPKVFFVGETRDRNDWKELLHFASTGHLGITTSHAGSLTEAMGQLMRVAGANNPARRSEVANCILALVHLRSKKVVADHTGAMVNIAVPAIWVRSPVSTKTLMADGLTSLLPFRDRVDSDGKLGEAGEFGCLGRSWFGQQLLDRAQPSYGGAFDAVVQRTTLGWDLEGI